MIKKLYGLVKTAVLLFILSNTYGQQPNVNKTTGAVSYSYPIWTLASKDVSYPIYLSYATNGIKVGQPAGNAGMGWNLVGEGVITRYRQDLPDDINTSVRKGWLHGGATATNDFIVNADEDYSVYSDEYVDYTALNNLGDYQSTSSLITDSEPDVFYINTPAFSGMFVFDENGTPQFSSKTNVTVTYEVDANGYIEVFRVTTNSGVIYTFDLATTLSMSAHDIPLGEEGDTYPVNLQQEDYYNFSSEITFNRQWYLTNISSRQGGNVSLNYRQHQLREGSSNFHLSTWAPITTDTINVIMYDGADYSEYPQYVLQYEEEAPYTLASVESSHHKVEIIEGLSRVPDQMAFYFTSAREPKKVPIDLRKPLVNAIRIYENLTGEETLLKRYILDYEYFKTYQDVIPTGQARSAYPFLMAVWEGSDDLNMNPPVNFDYYNLNKESGTVFLPNKYTHFKDLFGYFSPEAGSGELPKTYVYPDLPEAERYRYNPIPDYQQTVYILEGRKASRYDNRGLLSGLLKSITNSSGGITELTYEKNDYYDTHSQRNEYAGGVRVKSVTVSDGTNRSNDMQINYKYHHEDGTSSGTMLSRPQYAYNLAVGMDSLDLQPYYALKDLGAEEIWRKTTIRSDKNLSNDFFNRGGLMYTKTTISQSGLGKTVYTFNAPVYYGLENTTNWESTRTRFARESISTGTYEELGPLSTTYATPFAPQNSFGHLVGQNATVSVFNESGDLLSQTNNIFSHLNTATIQGIRKVKLKTTLTDGTLKDMFVYSPYTISLGVSTLLDERHADNYERVNSQLEKATVSSSNTYAASGYPYLKIASKTDAENQIYRTYYRYNHEYAVVAGGMDAFTQNIEKLDQMGREGIPMETYTTLELPGEAEKVISATLNHYKILPGDKVLPNGSEVLRVSSPLTDFTASSIDLATKTLLSDSRYERQGEITSVDKWQNVATIESRSKQQQTSLYDFEGQLAVLTGTGFGKDAIAFNNFELKNEVILQPLDDHEFIYNIGDLTNADEGRVFGRALNLTNTSTLTREIVKNQRDKNYIISTWVKATSAATIAIMVTDGSITANAAINVENTNNEWVYYEKSVDVSGLTGNISIQISSDAAVIIDDLLAYPEQATFGYTTFNGRQQKVAETDHNGISIYYEYDSKQRLKLVRDQNKNILKRNSYNNTTDVFEISPSIYYDGKIIATQPEKFEVIGLPDATGALLYWKVLELAVAENTPDPAQVDFSGVTPVTGSVETDLTFNTDTDKLVALKIEMPGATYYRSAVIPKRNILTQPVELDMCYDGSLLLDKCAAEEDGEPTSSCELGNTADITFQLTASGGDGSYAYAWYLSGTPTMSANATLLNGEDQATFNFNREMNPNDIYVIGRVSSGLQQAYRTIKVTFFESTPHCGIE